MGQGDEQGRRFLGVAVTALGPLRRVVRAVVRNLGRRYEAQPATIGASRAGRRIFDTMTSGWTPAMPARTSTAPIRAPKMACDELDGKPNNQVSRFQMMAPTSPAKTISGVTNWSLTMPPEMVFATSVDSEAPIRFMSAASSTAIFGLKAPVATEVAMALAESWKPLVKSNTKATITTIRTMTSIGTASPANSTRHKRDTSTSPSRWRTPGAGPKVPLSQANTE